MDLALFDFDGTLTISDSFVPFLRYSSSRLRWLVGSSLLLPVSVAYRLGALRASPARELASLVAFVGRSEKLLRELGVSYAREILPARIRPEVLRRLRWHLERGDQVAVVSASLDFYLDPWCATEGVDVLCSRLTSHRGFLVGSFLGEDCSGEAKVRRIQETYDLSTYSQIWGYGDTVEDFPMLRLADHVTFRGRKVVRNLERLSLCFNGTRNRIVDLGLASTKSHQNPRPKQSCHEADRVSARARNVVRER